MHQRGRYSEGRTQRGARSADVPAPELPDDVTPGQLDPAAREQLMSLPRSLADVIARHLVMTDRLFEEDPERAYLHARYAQKKASRVGAVREAAGVAAYRIGKWSEALAELRAARRITGDDGYLAVMADCERGLGRPERALELVRSSEGERLDRAEQIELRIVASGARRDLGEFDAAVLELQDEVRGRADKPWSARLFYAYADALLAAGREDEARDWFARSSAADEEGETDADERLAELEGLELVDVDEDVVWSDAEEREPGEAPGPGGPARD
ncbi:hypothetical protein [Allonocardiopsis opalescens]|uniref:hypothetical protein n=1 Tax=Allonocardiopsis opalescens TaxID=1144618 RepID=UPI0011B1D5E5|nr:hypothetical protein [Allonocardiopsis opalescens]